MVDQQHVARLYSLVTILDTLGAFVAGPCLPWLFQLGLRLREERGSDTWMGLPFLGTAGVCAVVAVGVFFVRVPERSEGGVVVDGEREGVDVEV